MAANPPRASTGRASPGSWPVDHGGVKAVIVAKLDRLTRSVKDLCVLLERFRAPRRVPRYRLGRWRLVLKIMTALSQSSACVTTVATLRPEALLPPAERRPRQEFSGGP